MGEFEKQKQENQKIESTIEIIHKPSISSFINLLSNVPFFGDLLISTTDDKLASFQKSKRESFYKYICDSPELITTDKVNDVTLLMEFARTLDVINKLSSNDKVMYIAKLFKACFLEYDNIDVYEYEEYLIRINDLSYRELELLILLRKHGGNNDEFDQEVERIYHMDREMTISILNGIARSGFCKERVGAFLDYAGGDFTTTSYFERFLSMIHIL